MLVIHMTMCRTCLTQNPHNQAQVKSSRATVAKTLGPVEDVNVAPKPRGAAAKKQVRYFELCSPPFERLDLLLWSPDSRLSPGRNRRN